MEKIIMSSGMGKTHQLILKSHETGAYIVCHSLKEATRIAAIAQNIDCKIPFPITYAEFANSEYYGKGIKGFLIDNVEMLLEFISRVPILAITLNP